MSERIIPNCHVDYANPTRDAVLVIDDEAGLGVWVSDGNRQPRMIENARYLLAKLKGER